MYTIYLAQRNEDMTEGRGRMMIIAAFTNEVNAKKAAVGQGVMGVGDGEVKPLKVYGDFREYANEHRKEV